MARAIVRWVAFGAMPLVLIACTTESDSGGSKLRRQGVAQALARDAGAEAAPPPPAAPSAPAPAPADAGGDADAEGRAPAEVPLSELTYDVVANGWGPVEKDMEIGDKAPNDGKTITLNGVTYAKGLGAHAASEIDVALGGGYQTFLSDVGVDDTAGDNGSVVFQVIVDGETVFDSGVMTGTSATKTVNVSVQGKQQLKLVATDSGDGIDYNHADWAGARLVK